MIAERRMDMNELLKSLLEASGWEITEEQDDEGYLICIPKEEGTE